MSTLKLSVKLRVKAIIFVILFAGYAFGRQCSLDQQPCQDTQTITTSGASVLIPANGVPAANFVEIVTGNPDSYDIAISGCMFDGKCDVLDSVIQVSANARVPAMAHAYDFYYVTATWTGGTNVAVQIVTSS